MARIFENGIGSYNATRRFLGTTALTAAGLALLSPGARAQDHAWTNFDTQSGSISTDISIPNTTNITQHSQVYIGNSNNLDILSHQTVNIGQSNNTALFVARSTREGEDPTRILGTLRTRMLDGSGNFTESVGGDVMVFDRNGVIFGRDSVVDVNSIIASTGNVSNADILDGDGRYEFSDFGDGKIELQGSVTVAQAGLAGFVSPFVSNSGVINAKMGKVAMAGGDKVTLDLYGDNLVEIAVDDKAADALLENAGVINAEGGAVIMTAQAAKEITDNIINVSGVVNASSATVKGGKIILGGGAQGKVTVSGKLDASGTKGGTIEATGEGVVLEETSELVADAGTNGKGGNIGVYGASYALMGGTASAKGGSESGDGGFVELSAGEAVGFNGLVDTSAASGETGTFLIDPDTINLGDFAWWDGGTLANLKVDDQAMANTLRLSNVHLWATNEIFTSSDFDISTWQGLIPSNKGITNNDLTLSANKISILHNITLGTGDLILRDALTTDSIFGFGLVTPAADINLATVDLNAKILSRSTVGGATSTAGAGQIEGYADLVNVLSPNAYINQGTEFVRAGGVVDVAAGTYEEQVVIKKNLTLRGANDGIAGDGARGLETIIRAPVTMTESFLTPSDNKAIVHVVGADNVIIDGIEVDGANRGSTNDRMIGIGYFNAGGEVKNAIVHGIMDTTFSGTQRGNAIYAYNLAGAGSPRTLDVTDNYVYDFQKNGITLNGEGLSGTVSGNRVEGEGATAVIAQNGIQVGFGANATVEDNDISGIGYTPTSWSAASILVYDAGNDVNIRNNRITGTGVDLGVSVNLTDNAEVSGNQIAGSGRGIVVTSTSLDSVISGNILNAINGDAIRVTGGSTGADILGNYIGYVGTGPGDAVPSTTNNINGDGIYVGGGANNAIIKGNYITETQSSTPDKGSGIFLDGVTGATVGGMAPGERNWLANIGWDGIKLNGGGSHSVVNNRLNNVERVGIYLGGVATALVQGNVLTNSNTALSSYAAIAADNGSGLTLTGNNVSASNAPGIQLKNVGGTNAISGNTLTGTHLGGQTTGIYAQNVNNLTIGGATPADANTVTDYGDGIYINGGTGTTLVKYNTLNSLGDDGIDVDGPTAGLTLSYNTINGTHGGHESNGIEILNTVGAILDNNKIYDTSWNNINVAGATGTQITNNTLDHSLSASGIGIWQSSNNTFIDANTITDSQYGIWNEGGSLEIGRNTITGHAVDGIYLTGTASANIHNNFLWSNGNAGVRVQNGTNNVTVYDNSFGNADGINNGNPKNIINNTGNMVQAGFNWWGSNVEATVVGKIVGPADISPYQGLGVDQDVPQPGYQGSKANLYVTDGGAQTGGLIQEAVDMAAVNGTVYLNDGTYTENVNLRKIGLKLDGLPGATVRYDAANSGINGTQAGSIFTVTAAGTNIDPIVFDGLGLASYGIFNVASGTIIDGNTFKNFVGDGLNNGFGIYSAANNADIKNNIFFSNAGNIRVSGGTGNKVTGNIIDGGRSGVILSFTGANNEVKNNTIGLTTGTNGSAIYAYQLLGATTIEGNHIYKAGWDGIEVNGGGTGFVTIKTNDIHNTLGASGIAVMNHTGDGLVQGNIIDGADRMGIYVLLADGLEIKGNDIYDVGREAGWWRSGIHLEAANGTTVEGNLIRKTGGSGIYVGAGNIVAVTPTSGNVIKNNVIGYTSLAAATSFGANNIFGDGIYSNDSDSIVIQGNKITDTSRTGVWDVGSGIQVVNTTGATIGGAAAGQNNTIVNAGWDGVRVANSSGVTVQKNTITAKAADDDARVGIYFGNVTGSFIKGNTVNNANRYGGIYAEGGSNLTISEVNKINNSDETGILLRNVGGKNLVDNNEINGTGLNVHAGDGALNGNGIHIYNVPGVADLSSGVTVSNNKIGTTGAANNIKGHGIAIIDSPYAQVKTNTIDEATGSGIFIDPSDHSVIAGNTITDVDLHGIHSAGNSHVRIGGASNSDRNYITNTQFDGIFVDGGTENIIQNNVINTTGDVGVIGNGIRVKDSTLADVIGNLVGYRRTSGHNTTTVSNSIHGDGILITGSNNADVKGNRTNGTESEVGTSGNGIHIDNSDFATVGGVLSSDRNIINDAEWDGVRVGNNSDNVTITNNKITNVTRTGIYLGHVDTATVNLNDIDDADEYFGIHVDGGDHITVDDNDIDDVAQDGIYADTVATSGLVIKNNDIGLNGGDIGDNGIEVQTSHGAVITGNETNDTAANGIYVNASNDIEVGGATGALGNTVKGAGANGIFVNGGSSALIQHNKVLGGAPTIGFLTLNDGVAGAQLDGIRVVSNDDVEVLNNTIAAGQGFEYTFPSPFDFITLGASGGNGANQHGIAVYGSDSAVIDQNNVLGDLFGTGIGAGWDGIHVEDSHLLTVGGLIPVLQGNKVFSTGFDGISIDGSIGALVLNNIVGGLPLMEVGEDGIDMDNTLGTIVAGNIITDVGDDGIEYTNGALSAMFLNFITGAGDDGIDLDTAALYLLAGNQISGSDSNGIEISNGHFGLTGWNDIDGSGADGINVRGSTFQLITNNDVTDSDDDGIDAGWVAFTTISDNTVDGAGDDGIQTFLGLDVNVDGNTVRNVDGDGIFAHTVLGLDVTDNHVFTTGDDGIDVRNSFAADIIGNDTHDTDGDGIQVRRSAFVDVVDNLVEDAGDDGIDVENSAFADIEENHVHGARRNGIEVENSFAADVNRNHVRGTGNDGIYVRNSWFADITRNLVEWAFGDGIDVEDSAFADIERNRVRYVADNGIEVNDSFAVDVNRNRVRGVGNDGIHVEGSAFADITNNRVRGAWGDGIDVENSFAADIRNNRIRYVADNGIEVQGSHFADIDNNNIRYVGDHGIYVNPSNHVDITNNRIRNVGDDGISVNGGHDITVYNNVIRDAGDDGIDVNGTNNITIELNNIRRSGNAGIELSNVDVANLLFNTLTNNDDYGLWARGGSNGLIVLSGNTFTNNPTGSLIQSGIIDLTGATNSFVGGEYGMVFDRFGGVAPLSLVAGPTLMAFTNGTFGTTSFTGQSEAYIVFANNAFSNGFNNPVKLDATYVNFGGFTANSKPRDAQGIPLLTQSEYDSIEDMVWHFGDDLFLGQILFGRVDPFDVDESKIFRDLNFGAFGLNGLNVRILGLPTIPGGPSAAAFNNLTPFAGGTTVASNSTDPAALNAIATAAGGDGATQPTTAQQLNAIDTAAGSDDQQVGCWGDAMNVASTGQAVNLNYGGGIDDVLSGAASCGSNL